MVVSEIGLDMFLFWVFKTPCSSLSVQQTLKLPFNKVWKNWMGSYFQIINSSPVHTRCLVALVIEFFLIFLSVDKCTKFDVPKEVTSHCWLLFTYLLISFFLENLSKLGILFVVLFCFLKIHLWDVGISKIQIWTDKPLLAEQMLLCKLLPMNMLWNTYHLSSQKHCLNSHIPNWGSFS